jgi:2-hydroxy-3-keto-5-methylthiopentenyl-1-phosphate phosphatase
MREARRAHRVIYVGDGASDFCVAPHADALLAKDRLLEHARSEGIPHQAIVDFTEAIGELDRLVRDEPVVEPDCIAR